MSVIVHTRGEVGGGVAAHLQCSYCGHCSKSHAQQLSHVAASHPEHLDRLAVGRLGNILMYQSTARLFHCADCFSTSRDFAKLYKHVISKHCMDEREAGGGEDRIDSGEREKMGEKGEEEEKAKMEEDEKIKSKMGDQGEEEEEKKKMESEGGEKEKMEEKDDLKRKRSSEAEEAAAAEGHDDDGAHQGPESVKPSAEGDESVLMFDGGGYHCLICGWKNKMKALGVNHVVRKHDIPKLYATQAIKRDAAAAATTPRQTASEGPEEEELVAGLSAELLKEEVAAMARVVRFISNRFVCLICGWKTKLKGFAISHVVRSHDVERPYSCKNCSRSFFLPSRLQQHFREAHRPGRYACPFCCFRSHYLGGFRRHCSRCNAREEGEVGGGGGGEEEEAEEIEEGEGDRKETRAGRKRRRTVKVIEEVEEDE
ncbi:zinc finger protein 771-like [Scophthalmus maximus]|uniref:zinc finger protein 771-like n=1 Tax=Scophthalmus maximus TaxID=52904 RepID=UPI001FA852BA|nr:zinc finger protein 771-like [Scophthalmus maximus]